MIYAPVNFNFAHELLLGPALRNAGLLDDFSCLNSIRSLIYEAVALGEATLAQELSLNVAACACVATW